MKANIPLMIGSLEVPSGKTFDRLDLQIAAAMAKHKSIRLLDESKPGVSGVSLWSYVELRDDLTDHPDFVWLVGRKIALFLRQLPEREGQFNTAVLSGDQLCLIGVPVAGAPLAQAASMVSQGEGIFFGDQPICHRAMREAEKRGKSGQWMNGPPRKNHYYCLIDNAMTTGLSIRTARERLAIAYPGMPCVVLVDRQQGGTEKTPNTFAIYNLFDLAYAFWRLDLWTKAQFMKVEKEIQVNQF
jgi:orotate phosphoribosyltransferase